MTTSLLSDAVAHHVWATERLIDACSALTPEQLETPVPGTYGSILDTMRHLVDADSWYLSFFRDRTVPADEEAEMNLAELRSVVTTNGAEWTEVMAGATDPDADIVERENGWEVHAPVGVRLAQVVHHGTDHRSQICTALTSLGLTPPEIDVWAFARTSGRERVVPPAP
jgi:uncharacterized damage-inducible protein DinB